MGMSGYSWKKPLARIEREKRAKKIENSEKVLSEKIDISKEQKELEL